MKIKKLATILVTSAMLLGPAFALADTTTVTASAQVQSMITQIQNLQAQLTALKAAQTQVASTSSTVKDTLSLIRNLKQGMTGSDVATLQAILAADPTIYPQGTVSGFFGKLTAEAVKKFQKKHGLDPLGLVGPQTLKKLNQEKNKLGLSEEDDDDNESGRKDKEKHGKKLCAKVPPGHLIAPGWLKKNARPIVPECQKIPKGIGDRDHGDNNNNSSTTPLISNRASASVMVGGTIYDTVTLSYGNAPTGTVSFQVYAPGDTTCVTPLTPALASVAVNGNGSYNSGNFTTTATGTYRFIATYSGDSKNKSVHTNCTDSLASVNVTAVPDTTAPVISAVGTTNLLGTTTSIVWTTNENSTSKVWFGLTSPLVLGTSSVVTVDGSVTSHTVPLSLLATSTIYNYIVVSTDGSGNTASSTQSSFLTGVGL